MRVYGYGTASFYTYLILMLAGTETSRDKLLDEHYGVRRQKPDKSAPSYSKTVQLYSKSSAKFVQVLKRVVNASASHKSEAAMLTIETEAFGKIRIKHYKSNYYICMNAKGDIFGLSEKKGKKMKRCVYREVRTKDGYVRFMSDKFGKNDDEVSRYLAFRQTGEPKNYKKVDTKKQRATKFLVTDINNPQKRNVKRNVRRRRIKYEFLSQEKSRHKKRHESKICLRYVRCLHKNWKLKRLGKVTRTTRVRCRRVRRRNYCKCKCAKQ